MNGEYLNNFPEKLPRRRKTCDVDGKERGYVDGIYYSYPLVLALLSPEDRSWAPTTQDAIRIAGYRRYLGWRFGGIKGFKEHQQTPYQRACAAARTANARALELGVEGTLDREELFALFVRSGHRCCWCGSTENLCPDHVIPMSKNGKNTIDNIQILCIPCNSSKGNRDKPCPSRLKKSQAT